MSRAAFSRDILWRFAGYLAGEARVEDAAKWAGAAAADGQNLLRALCNLMGPQAV